MELSTTMPVAKARPARLMTFIVLLNTAIIRKVPITLMGIVSAAIRVLPALRRKTASTRMARAPPIIRLLRTRSIELLM